MFWIFDIKAKADAQNAACAKRLEPDTLANGETAPTQITSKWSEPVQLPSGEWALDVMPDCPCNTALRTVDSLGD